MIKHVSLGNDELLDKLVREASEKIPAKQAQQAANFIHRYYQQVPTEDLIQTDSQDLAGAALAHWQRGYKRKPGETIVRVYNPHFERDGWQSTHTIIEVITEDKPFLCNSISMLLNRKNLTTHLTIHPIMFITRDKKHEIVAVHPHENGDDCIHESFMQFQVNRQTDNQDHQAIEDDIRKVIADVERACNDWPAMTNTCETLTTQLRASHTDSFDTAEAADLLEWIRSDHFTFLGYCAYSLVKPRGKQPAHLKAETKTALGLMRPGDDTALDLSEEILPASSPLYALADEIISVTKANVRSSVHRPSYLDLITIQQYDAKGKITGKHCFLGLFTSAAYVRSTEEIPLLRKKTRNVIAASDLNPGSHNGKALINILENFPRDTLFQSPEDDIHRMSMGILQLQERQRIRLFGRQDDYRRFYTCLVHVPSDHYSRELRIKIQEVLEHSMQGRTVEFDTTFSSESTLARIFYVIKTDPTLELDIDLREIEMKLVDAARSWQDKLSDTLNELHGEEQGYRLFTDYKNAFPSAYLEDFSPRTGGYDINHIEKVRETDALGLNFYKPLMQTDGEVRLKLYESGTFIPLSDVLPMLENMGLKVNGERPYMITPQNGEAIWIHEFSMCHAAGIEINPAEVGEAFQEAFARIWRGDVENDGFNRLVLGAGLSWRDTAMLRSYCKYLLQIRVPFSQSYMIETLSNNPAITRNMVQLFQQRFEPLQNGADPMDTEALESTIANQLEDVTNLDEDRILRSFLNVIKATLRTNYYQCNAVGEPKDYISFKLMPNMIKGIPLPTPMYEIFVCSPRVEGVHLRGGAVARGGLRWSDRREDFRTEVLALMKAQMVKNSVIVPVGSKGGFVVKQPPQGASRDAVMKEVVACYSTFLKGMLDITDNLVSGEVKPPAQVNRYDGDDPYLVIAADKGTATFSDIANGIAEEYGFWLGDAFASGGSIGYDHKKMGITAKGAWESVKRHFRELGVNTQASDFTVVGVGDMGGDVFGNGMMLSEHIRLVGAFNHLHIFLDPTPDAASTFKERQRLFNLPRSSWEDFDQKLISKGGGIFSRSAKSIKLTPQIRKALDTEETVVTPNELINIMLKAPVDLLWNGGIGTYVKSKTETHDEVRDRANDAVRVNGDDLRCKVVGEGGNLGFTQLGRIEYARTGGLIYTDAIDNSAGVDCSDHEVNIKILINQIVDNGDMTQKQRNKLLEDMTDEVSDLVLKDNYLQTQCISIANAQAASMLEEHARFIADLENQGKLNRGIEYLPDQESITERLSNQQGLLRPELAVIVSYSKMTLFDDVLDTSLPEDQFLNNELVDYFPKRLSENYSDNIAAHRLKREIIATHLTNCFVNHMGPVFAYRMHNEHGAEVNEILSAYAAVRAIFDMPSLWQAIDSLDNQVNADTQIRMHTLVNGLVERSVQWLIAHRRNDASIEDTINYFKPGIDTLLAALPEPLAEENSVSHQQRVDYFAERDVPNDLAVQISNVVPMSSSLDIVDIANHSNVAVEKVAHLYFELGAYLELQWLRDQIAELKVRNHWHSLARSRLRTDLHDQQRALTAQALDVSGQKENVEQMIAQWAERNQHNIENYQHLLNEMKAGSAIDFAMLSLAVNEVHNLLKNSF